MTRDERAKIARALAAAEDGTTGWIGVRIIPDAIVDAFPRAQQEFKRAGLHRHEPQNGALILVAPKAQKFAVIGDRALHERVGDSFWRDVVEGMQPYFSRGAMYDGIVHGIERVGIALHMHFALPSTEDGP